MDTQEILTSLAEIKENLSAIDSARKQVQNNVAAYDKVQKQLSATSANITKILSDFTSISKMVKDHEKAMESNIEYSKQEIFKILEQKALAISDESASMLDSLKNELDSLKAEVADASHIAIQRINDNVTEANSELNKSLKQIQKNFAGTINSSITAFQEELNQYNTNISRVNDSFETSVTAHLNQLSDSVNRHIEKYNNLIQSLASQIEILKTCNENLGSSISSMESTLTNKLDEFIPEISKITDQIKDLTSDIRADIRTRSSELTMEVIRTGTMLKSEIQDSVSKTKSDLIDYNEANKKRIEKLESQISSEMGLLRSSLEQKINDAKKQSKASLTTTIICFLVLIMPIALILLRVFRKV